MKIAKQIISKKSIERAVGDYQKLADIDIKENDSYWEVDFVHCRYDEKITEMEFENYLIGLENVYM